MTVKELRMLINQYSDDTEVFIDMLDDCSINFEEVNNLENDNIWVSSVRDLYDDGGQKRVKDMKMVLKPCEKTKGKVKVKPIDSGDVGDATPPIVSANPSKN